MKNSIILFVLGILGYLTSNAQLKIGFTGGIDYSKMIIHREYQDDFGIQGIPGYHFGLATKYQVGKNVSLMTDFLFAKKGFSQPTSQAMLDKDRLSYNVSDVNVSLYYIEIPVLTEFKVEFEKMNVLFGIGPYISYGIDGDINMDIKSASSSINYSDKIRWSKSNGMGSDINESIVDNLGYSQIKRFDYGPIVRFGIEYNSFIVNAEFQYGLANLMWEYRQQERMNNQSLGLSFKYLFNLNKQ
jgi:hypothetical protein